MKEQLRPYVKIFGLALLVAGGIFITTARNSVPEAEDLKASSGTSGASLEVAKPSELPTIGKWSISADGTPAHWLGESYHNKSLREPVNVILVDNLATSAEDAKSRVVAAAKLAGYPIREGHSAGYQAMIGGDRYGQLPSGNDHAFSNAPFELNNNHGRIFGPHRIGRSWVFTAAFSRENVAPMGTPKHRYRSFNQARDDFTQKMDQFTAFKIVRFVELDNAILGNAAATTGDHDGIGVMLKVRADTNL